MAGQIRLPEMNLVFLTGRLTRDPDNRMTQRGQAICGFDIAVNRRYMDNASGEWKDEVTYVPVTVFGDAAERAKDRLKKGVPVLVEGRLTMSEFVDKSGQNRKILRVTGRRVQILQSADAFNHEDSDMAQAQDASEVAEDDVPF
ncbi:single-stranded DNA-binding protein [Candidatus Proelusimicrobium volucris]|uniref:single-stranded DNA-binding protein n=1 Tax=Candidatus Proelusimicrobium volucris TaxID=3416225 RepID=UPI003D13A6AA